MDRVVVAPAPKRRQEQQADTTADVIVRAFGREHGAVGAVVENDEGPHQKPCRKHDQCQGERKRDAEREVHQCRNREIRHGGRRDLDHASAETRLRVGAEQVRPGTALG